MLKAHIFDIFSVLPLLRDSVGILMQRTPRELDTVLGGAYERVCSLHYNNYIIQEVHLSVNGKRIGIKYK